MPKFFGPMTKAQALAAQARAAPQPRRVGGRTKAQQRAPRRSAGAQSTLRSTGRGQTWGASAPAAVSMSARDVGMTDLKAHSISWLAGYIYVGNGTLGATNGVYYMDPSKTYTVTNFSSNGNNVPFSSADSIVGVSYASDLQKHYGRKILQRARLRIVPIFPATSNSMSVILAPQRGPQGIGQVKTDATAGIAYTTVLGMHGAKQCASWEGMEFDLTPYIAGGSGAKQNEFMTTTAISQGPEGGYVYAALQNVPLTFCVSGNNSTTALQGTVTHAIIGTEVLDLVDFIGSNNAQSPEIRKQFSALSPDRVRPDLKEPVSSTDTAGPYTAGTDARLHPLNRNSKMSGGDSKGEALRLQQVRTFSVENDDVKSLFEEKVDREIVSKRSESIERGTRPMPAPQSSKKESGK